MGKYYIKHNLTKRMMEQYLYEKQQHKIFWDTFIMLHINTLKPTTNFIKPVHVIQISSKPQLKTQQVPDPVTMITLT